MSECNWDLEGENYCIDHSEFWRAKKIEVSCDPGSIPLFSEFWAPADEKIPKSRFP